MSRVEADRMGNRLLKCLPEAERARLAPMLDRCQAGRGEILFDPDQIVDKVWFPESGIGSLVTISADGSRVETGLFGRDGFAPVAPVLGADRTTNRAFFQVAGSCLRLSLPCLDEALARCAAFRSLLLRYTHCLAVQTDHTAVSNASHPIDQRLARWLLMCHDRIEGSELELTHDFLALMLAVRRPSVTTAVHVLEGRGLVRSERGCMIVRNRDALEEFAGAAYGAPEREYRRLIGDI